MKSIVALLLLALTNSISAASVVYPLLPGTRWQFHGLPLADSRPSAPTAIIKDTVMANGKRYAIIHSDDSFWNEYQRYSNDTVYIYDGSAIGEQILFRFNAHKKDTVATRLGGHDTVDTILLDTATQMIFGRQLRTYKFVINGRRAIDDERVIIIADSIGVIRVQDAFGYASLLGGAFIDGTTYGAILVPSLPYYPLAIGNEWFFNDLEEYGHKKIVTDTLFPNGYRYYALNRDDFAGGMYVRADSHYVYYYDAIYGKEVPAFKLDDKIGNKRLFTGMKGFYYSTILSIDTVLLFGERTRVIHYRQDGIIQRDISLSDKFGLISAAYYGDPPAPWPDGVSNLIGCIIDGKKYGIVLSVNTSSTIPIVGFALHQNYPNPFNPSTTISFSLPSRSYVTLKIFDVMGRDVSTIVNEEIPAGSYARQWNAASMPSGVYFYRLQSGGYSETKSLVLLR
jgi:hypothetical protein